MLAAGAAVRLVYVLTDSSHAGAGALAWIVPAVVTVGALLYAAFSRPDGRRALLGRRAGWWLMVAALAIPSTFSLALPLVALLVVTLGGAPETQRSEQLAGH